MFEGLAHHTALFFQREQFYDRALWAKFADVFRTQPDEENRGWRGEYWGKMMQGGGFGVRPHAPCHGMRAADRSGRALLAALALCARNG